MTAEANRRLLLPPSLTATEHLEQAAESMSAPTLWVRGSAGERTRLPDKTPEPKAGLQIQIALPIASGKQSFDSPPQPPPPPQVVFRSHEVIRPPPVSDGWGEQPGPPGNAPLDPVDAPPGLVDHPPGFEEEPDSDEAFLAVESSVEGAPVVLESPASEEPGETSLSSKEEPPVASEELRASPSPVLPSDYYEGAPGTLPLDPVDAPPGLADLPPGFEDPKAVEETAVGAGSPGLEDRAQPPIRPIGIPLNLPPVAHHQVGASMEGPSKLAPPVRPMAQVEEPPEWRPYEEAREQAEALLVVSDEAGLVSDDVEEISSEPPGLEMDALDELEEDMQLFSDLSEHSISELEDDAVGEPWSDDVAGAEPTDLAVAESTAPIEAVPRSVAAEAVESAWEARPLSERLAAASLVVLGVWATWKIWSVL